MPPLQLHLNLKLELVGPLEHVHDEWDICKIIEVWIANIDPNLLPTEFEVVAMQRLSPTVGVARTGQWSMRHRIHLMAPAVLMEWPMQQHIRSCLLDRSDIHKDVFVEMGCINTCDNILDVTVFRGDGWTIRDGMQPAFRFAVHKTTSEDLEVNVIPEGDWDIQPAENVMETFIKQWVEVTGHPFDRVDSTDMERSFTKFMESRKMEPLERRQFLKEMRQLGYPLKKSGGITWFTHMTLNPVFCSTI